ncbi:hypothetical protein BWO94_13825 [Staphylococcus aureus]|nr:hypothetical protein BRL61_02545 [Staphylococcus aureus]OOC88808.1 hypothetical protein BWO94_13825 [Staphylococcus aureus]OUL40541.1 hypothetical protein B1R31_13095 [Staphylococcus aureus]
MNWIIEVDLWLWCVGGMVYLVLLRDG